ncbi:hypothetical protein [Bacillus sp. OK048]|nr:hypothetical protein [Bacillus sp. OK048]SDN51088.1 hypothetical protein SAMN05443253_11320 [Bacillus sp. OK048]
MRNNSRVQKKIVAFSYFCKCLGIINKEEYKQITGKSFLNNPTKD